MFYWLMQKLFGGRGAIEWCDHQAVSAEGRAFFDQHGSMIGLTVEGIWAKVWSTKPKV
jgi:hypothetical protein